MVGGVSRRNTAITLLGNGREGVSLLTHGEVLHHMALRVRQGEWGSLTDNSELLSSALLSLAGYWKETCHESIKVLLLFPLLVFLERPVNWLLCKSYEFCVRCDCLYN